VGARKILTTRNTKDSEYVKHEGGINNMNGFPTSIIIYAWPVALICVIMGTVRCYKYGGDKKKLAIIPVVLLAMALVLPSFVYGYYKGSTGKEIPIPIEIPMLVFYISASVTGIFLYKKFKPPANLFPGKML
jgi:hypothetical protein